MTILTHDDFDFEAEYFDAMIEDELLFKEGFQVFEIEEA